MEWPRMAAGVDSSRKLLVDDWVECWSAWRAAWSSRLLSSPRFLFISTDTQVGRYEERAFEQESEILVVWSNHQFPRNLFGGNNINNRIETVNESLIIKFDHWIILTYLSACFIFVYVSLPGTTRIQSRNESNLGVVVANSSLEFGAFHRVTSASISK